MMKFVLMPAGEREFKADVWCFKGRQKIVGSWSMGEDDVMQIEFKLSFSSPLWAPISFNGRFDPERDALTGVWGWLGDALTGVWSSDALTGVRSGDESSERIMEFRRIPSCYLTIYPTIKELRDNKPRALWKFAIAAVRNDIRRDHWTWSYFSQRRDDRKTVISLSVRSRWFGPPLSDDEDETIRAIMPRLLPDDACFYDSMVDRIRAYTYVHE
jgi:hypothetical protein